MYSQLYSKIEGELKALQGDITFPYMYCKIASERLQDAFGFLIVRGAYYGNCDQEYKDESLSYWKAIGIPEGIGYPHRFNYDPETRLFIDITASQFAKSNPPILLIGICDPAVSLSISNINDQTTHSVEDFFTKKEGKVFKLKCTNPVQFEENGQPMLGWNF